MKSPSRMPEAILHEQAAILKAIGGRMRETREMCAMSQTVAAKRLGLPSSSNLAKIENATDIRTVPEWLVARAAKLYRVSRAYLYGFTDDWEIGSRVAQEREVGAYLLDTLETMRRRDMEALAQLHDHMEGLRASIALTHKEAERLIDGIKRFTELNPGFEEMRGSAMVAGPAERIVEACEHGVRQIARFRQKCQLAARDTHQLSLQLI